MCQVPALDGPAHLRKWALSLPVEFDAEVADALIFTHRLAEVRAQFGKLVAHHLLERMRHFVRGKSFSHLNVYARAHLTRGLLFHQLHAKRAQPAGKVVVAE